MEDKSPQKGKKLGVGRKLNKEQEAEIFNLITRKRPFQLSIRPDEVLKVPPRMVSTKAKMIFIRSRAESSGFKLPYKNVMPYLWTRALLMKLINWKFKIELTDGGVVNYLSRWGFPSLNRAKSKYEQCPKSIQQWLDKHLATINARSKDENAQIFWMGDIEPDVFKASGTISDKKFTLIPVIENQGRLHWLTVRGRFSPERQVMLLKSLVGQSNTKIFLIRNNVNHFTSPLVVDWLSDNKMALEIFPPPEWELKS